ncbi:hypothetical protein [Embleya scabrispora]|uniref:hypothetical protein n=1 Tax=Embleya scabrispora TaxID=159449 RepID=UPI0003764813|nr:hypothetical protein [Embleya scabrispora]MYS84175.1 hypothetical protein [Streptomyces sp. SID5474]
MSAGRGRVHLGDLVRAIVALEVTDIATAARIARMLDLGGAGDPETRTDIAAEPSTGAGDDDPEPAAWAEPVPTAPESALMPPHEADGGCSVLTLRGPTQGTESGASGAGGPGGTSGASRGAESDPVGLRRLLDPGVGDGPPEPPWAVRWAPGVMFAAASTDVFGRILDDRTLVRAVADRSPVRRLPLRTRPTTRLGIQLVLDGGESMLPFRADQRWLRELADAVVGRGRVEVLRFQGTPWRGVRTVGRCGRVAYRVPAAGTPVVVVSDLGLRRLPFSGASAAGAAEWRDWLDAVRRAECPVVCLTPYPARAHPWTLRRRVALIPLDRRTSIRAAWRESRRVREGVPR